MGGRAVEGTGLENRRRCKPLVGSNPTPSGPARETRRSPDVVGHVKKLPARGRASMPAAGRGDRSGVCQTTQSARSATGSRDEPNPGQHRSVLLPRRDRCTGSRLERDEALPSRPRRPKAAQVLGVINLGPSRSARSIDRGKKQWERRDGRAAHWPVSAIAASISCSSSHRDSSSWVCGKACATALAARSMDAVSRSLQACSS